MITIKTQDEIKRLREGGAILAEALKAGVAASAAGVTLEEIDAAVEAVIEKRGGEPAFKGYTPGGAQHPYPAATCISVNEVVVHGIPTDQKLREGDIVTIDAGVIYEGLYTDSAVTVPIGEVGSDAKKLLYITQKSLSLGIKEARLGNTIGDISHAIGSFIAKNDLVVIRNLTGHGVGYAVHEDPVIYNFGRPGSGERLKEGMVIAIEPMVSLGAAYTAQMDDDSFVTTDGSLSAHFEHTIAITKGGPLILTK